MHNQDHNIIEPDEMKDEVILNQPSGEAELSDQELEEISGGITPIPIPFVALNSPTIQQSLKSFVTSKSFEKGSGLA